ncbi:MAG: hypothetical protein LBP73_01930 [Clostridiales Family XIII bacterium]|jgi:hypothetical protein|nr:hypothetical protein [Clostridiales Family XIII bacterium]
MIRPLSEINEEFRAEITDAPPLAQENDDVAGLLPSFKEDGDAKPVRSLPLYKIPIAIAIVAVILMIIAAFIAVKGMPAREDVSDGAGLPQAGTDASGAASESEGDAAAQGLGEGEYDSALESVENEINAARESQGTGEGEDVSDAEARSSLTKMELAALYLYILGPDRMEDADLSTEAEVEPSRKSRLAERIDAYISERASEGAMSLPTDEEINSDLEFTDLTEPANALFDAINAGRADRSRLPEVIDLRERAYEIYPVRVLKKLLAGDYEKLGLYYAPTRAMEAFDAFIYAIKYRMEYLSEFPPGSAVHRAERRLVANIFAEIAEIDGLDAAYKWHAELIAGCL